jgi:hypothetical protein
MYSDMKITHDAPTQSPTVLIAVNSLFFARLRRMMRRKLRSIGAGFEES